MPKEAINLEELMQRIHSGKIIGDKPLFEYLGEMDQKFPAFQDSGLNILLGNEGNGKTKFLTHCIYRYLDIQKTNKRDTIKRKVLYVDTERPESQYAFSIKHIVENTIMEEKEAFENLSLLSVMDLPPDSIMQAVNTHIANNIDHNYLIIIDHILPMVSDMNSTSEATEIDLFLKTLLCAGHIIIASIHKPYSGLAKGLGHLGSALQRLASFILEISNSEEGNGFSIKHIKSRISAKSNTCLFLEKDENGNIIPNCIPEFRSKPIKTEKENNVEIAKEILQDFVDSKYSSKKELLSIIREKKNLTESSSGQYSFFNEHLKTMIDFNKDGCTLTEEGTKLLNNDTQ